MSQKESSLTSPLLISDILYYPIKSLNGISTSQIGVEPQGIKNDRLMMLVDSDGLFITQRKYPQLALIDLQIKQSKFDLAAEGGEPISIDDDCFTDNYQPVKIWKDQCHAQIASESINQWFSDYLNQQIKLVRYDHQRPRQSDAKYSKVDDIVSFADGFPLLVISEASLDDLNSRLTNPVSMDNFRANLIVKGGSAYQEDCWKTIKIGDVIFDAVKRCERCILTTIDPQTGIKSASREPLKTLQTYRQENGKTYFGMNLIPRSLAQIKRDDVIEILEVNR